MEEQEGNMELGPSMIINLDTFSLRCSESAGEEHFGPCWDAAGRPAGCRPDLVSFWGPEEQLPDCGGSLGQNKARADLQYGLDSWRDGSDWLCFRQWWAGPAVGEPTRRCYSHQLACDSASASSTEFGKARAWEPAGLSPEGVGFAATCILCWCWHQPVWSCSAYLFVGVGGLVLEHCGKGEGSAGYCERPCASEPWEDCAGQSYPQQNIFYSPTFLV